MRKWINVSCLFSEDLSPFSACFHICAMLYKLGQFQMPFWLNKNQIHFHVFQSMEKVHRRLSIRTFYDLWCHWWRVYGNNDAFPGNQLCHLFEFFIFPFIILKYRRKSSCHPLKIPRDCDGGWFIFNFKRILLINEWTFLRSIQIGNVVKHL